MRRKINGNHLSPRITDKSDIYKRFRKIFDVLLQSRSPAKERQEYNSWYVTNRHVEEILTEHVLESPIDSVCVLLGHTGVGKSTTVQYLFNGVQTRYDKQEQRLVIYISCNPTLISTEQKWTTAFCGYLGDSSAKVCSEENVSVTQASLSKFIRGNRGDLLYRPVAPEGTSDEERLALLQKEDRRAYELEKLKLVLLQAKVEHVVVVLDDIESLPLSLQALSINELFHAFECLQNNAGRRYHTSLLIAMRPDTFVRVKSAGSLTAYAYEEIQILLPVELDVLFEKRFAEAMARPEIAQMATSQHWQISYQVLMQVVQKLQIKFAKTLTALENYNVRNALQTLRIVLENRRWFQRGKNVHDGAFQIAELDFAVNDAGVLRALCMPDRDAYFDDERTPICNIFRNRPDKATDLVVSYILRFAIHSSAGNSTWIPVDLSELLTIAAEVFPLGMRDSAIWQEAIQWMVKRGLLFHVDPAKVDLIYSVTPRALELWDLLPKNSLLLQAYREDIFRDFSDRLHLAAPSVKMRFEDVLLDCVELTLEIAQTERVHLEAATAKDRLADIPTRFGPESLALRVLTGLDASVDQFFQGNLPSNLRNRIDVLRSFVSRNAELLEGAK